MSTLNAICVFCGSSRGARPEYAEAARRTGLAIARRGATLIYGGGKVGLMGIVADAALEAGGRVVGILPVALEEWEVGHRGLTELHIVDSMHARKARMAEEADAFLALPGGMGTWEELCEILTWSQLGIHHKPVGLLNSAGYYDSLLVLFDTAVRERFLRPEQRALLLTEPNDPEALMDRLALWEPPLLDKFLDR